MKIGDGMKFVDKLLSYFDKHGACLVVILLIFGEYLHEELSKRVDIPYTYLMLELINHRNISTGKDTESKTRHSITLGYRFDDDHVGILLQVAVAEKR